MKEATANHAPHARAAASSKIRKTSAPSKDGGADVRKDAVVSDLTVLRRALALREREARAAHNVIRRLKETNARLTADIARLERREEQARAFAYLDELTGLPNRRLLQDRLRQAIAQCARQDQQLALLFIDLDGFKRVNDTLGHAIGDALLKRVADRIASSIRAADTACRYGGDEFVIMLPIMSHPSLAEGVAEKIRVSLAEPYAIDGFRIEIAASIGTALYPDHGLVCEELMKRADEALYRVKANRSEAAIARLPGGSAPIACRIERCAAARSAQ
jgi:diguanylate cyclase